MTDRVSEVAQRQALTRHRGAGRPSEMNIVDLPRGLAAFGRMT